MVKKVFVNSQCDNVPPLPIETPATETPTEVPTESPVNQLQPDKVATKEAAAASSNVAVIVVVSIAGVIAIVMALFGIMVHWRKRKEVAENEMIEYLYVDDANHNENTLP